MDPLVLLCIAGLALAAGGSLAILHFRADARRTREAELATFQHSATVRGPMLPLPIEKLERDQRLAFHGRVKQQVRVIRPHAKQPLRIVRPGDV